MWSDSLQGAHVTGDNLDAQPLLPNARFKLKDMIMVLTTQIVMYNKL